MEDLAASIQSEKSIWVGKRIHELPTPCLLVDFDSLKKNLSRMQSLVTGYNKALRPHIKTHKCSLLAGMQLEMGAIGITCATVREAEAMASAGIQDILIANQIVTADKLERVARMTSNSQPKFVVDSSVGIETAGRSARNFGIQFEVLVEVDTGGNRCGAQTPAETLELVRMVLRNPFLIFGGIQAYNGGTSYIKNLDDRKQQVDATDEILRRSLEMIQNECHVPRVSGAGSGNSRYHLQNGLLSEIQSGSYVYSDTTYRELMPEYSNALFVLSTVLSRSTADRVVMDAGLKALGTEFSTPEIYEYPSLIMDHYSEEHVQWFVSGNAVPQIGEKVRIIPSHCCTTVNHYRSCFVIEGDTVVDVWQIDAF